MLISKIAINPKAAKRNILKTTESLIPSLMNPFVILFHCRNRSMNANALLNTLTLRRGNVDKVSAPCFLKLALCLSYTSDLRKQLALRKNHPNPVTMSY